MQHPGLTLKEKFLAPLGLNGNQLARGLGVHRSTISRLLNGKGRITPELAARMGKYFGVPPGWWVSMQGEWDLSQIPSGLDLNTVSPLPYNPDLMLTPKGVVVLPPEEAEVGEPLTLPSASPRAHTPSTQRQVKEVRYESGSVALVGVES